MTTNTNLASDFAAAWDRYYQLCKGKLAEKDAQGPLDAAPATMAVRSAEHVWFDPFDPCGEWLQAVEQVDAVAAQRLKNAIRTFTFTQVPEPAAPSPALAPAAAAGGAVAGVAIATFAANAGMVATLAAAAVPAAVIYPAVASYQGAQQAKAHKDAFGLYLDQLRLLREEMEGIACLLP